MKKVRAAQDIVFEGKDVSLIPKGTIYEVGGVLGSGVILHVPDGDDYVIDAETFENGFEIAEL